MSLSSAGHREAELAIDLQTPVVREIKVFQFRSRSSERWTRDGSTSHSGSLSSILRNRSPTVSSRYSFPSRRMCKSRALVKMEFPRKSRFASTVAVRPRSRTRTSLSWPAFPTSLEWIRVVYRRRLTVDSL